MEPAERALYAAQQQLLTALSSHPTFSEKAAGCVVSCLGGLVVPRGCFYQGWAGRGCSHARKPNPAVKQTSLGTLSYFGPLPT